MKTTIEDRSAMRARLSDITGEGIVALIDDIDSLESLVHRQAELLERAKPFIEQLDQIIAGAVMAERDRCAEIARDCHGCSGLQTAKEILNPTPRIDCTEERES